MMSMLSIRLRSALLIATLALLLAAPTAQAAPGRGNSAATITASFTDSCRDFAAHSSKDISHVELNYADGRVVKDEGITRPDYALDGSAGEEIELTVVKSGTTRERFECVQANGPPTALLEIETPESCGPFFSGGLQCDQSVPRTDWTIKSEIPDDGGDESGFLTWGCEFANNPALCPFVVSFHGTNSSDPGNDIASWLLEFSDGTSASGDWGTDPPTEVSHDYLPFGDFGCGGFGAFDISTVCPVTLRVTDAAGQSDSETIVMSFVDWTPD